ncbi:protein of unknown function [Nitrospira japonica]|uniref:Uncharacterized protein n=1 Tax=Nitrospira japonica TaxID=1325564 RepID=A0A1W1I7I6_9BACT|nr:protein of unknown function [Nitrospira japonica]
MPVQPDTDTQAVGRCADCGKWNTHLVGYVDTLAPIRLELCDLCWHARQHRQNFSGGCCG